MFDQNDYRDDWLAGIENDPESGVFRIPTATGTWEARRTAEGDWGLWEPDGRGSYRLYGEVYWADPGTAAETARWAAAR